MTTFPVGVELNVGGTWTDVSTRAKAFPPTIHRGRPDESSAVTPTTATVVLDNTDGYLTPRNPVSPWYPHIRRNLPCRLSVAAGTPYLLMSGAAGGRATTPDNAALDITGDLFMLAELPAPIDLPASTTRNQVLAKWNSGSNQRSYYLALDTFGRVVLFWSTDGTAVPAPAMSTYAIPMRTAGPITFAVHLDVNVGGTSHVARFWGIHGTRDQLIAALVADETAVRLGDPYTASGTTSIFASTSPLEVGDITGTSEDPYPGGVHRAQVRSGDWTGTIVANPDFTIQTVGATGFTDSATRVWAIQGDAKITNRQHRFVGSVDAIDLDWPKATERTGNDPGVAHVTMTLAGLLRQMQQGDKPLFSTLRRLVTAPAIASRVHAYWPMEDGADATEFASPIPGVQAAKLLGTIKPATDSTFPASDALPNLQAGDTGGFDGKVPVFSDTNWLVDRFVNIPTSSATHVGIYRVFTSGTAARWTITVNNSVITIVGHDIDNGGVVLDTHPVDATFFGENRWVLWSLGVTQNGGNVDWEITVVPIPDGVGFGTSGSYAGTVGRVTRVASNIVGPTDGMSGGHVIVTSDLGVGWLAGGDTAWVGETAAHRVWRLCNEELIPVAVVGDNTIPDFFRGDPSMSQLMGPQGIASLPTLLQECADVDFGILYEQRGQRGIAFRTGRSLTNQTDAMTLDGTQEGLTAPFAPVLDDQRIRNDCTVKRPEGASYRVIHEESIADEGLYNEELTRNVQLDMQLGDQAGWCCHQGTWPELRLPAINTSMLTAGNPVLLAWLNVDLGDRFTATNLMRQYDSSTAHLLEGYDETLSLFQWEAAIVGSPAGLWETGIRNDNARGKRDAVDTALNNAVDTTAVSLTINTPTGPLWTLDAAEFPFDIDVGGERMTVTDIDPFASTVQVMDVVRSVNGIVKAHAVGAAVRLWRPTIRSL